MKEHFLEFLQDNDHVVYEALIYCMYLALEPHMFAPEGLENERTYRLRVGQSTVRLVVGPFFETRLRLSCECAPSSVMIELAGEYKMPSRIPSAADIVAADEPGARKTFRVREGSIRFIYHPEQSSFPRPDYDLWEESRDPDEPGYARFMKAKAEYMR